MSNVEATASGHLTCQCAPHLMWEVQDVHLLCGIIANDCNEINCKYITKRCHAWQYYTNMQKGLSQLSNFLTMDLRIAATFPLCVATEILSRRMIYANDLNTFVVQS